MTMKNMSKKPLISTIIPTFNRVKLLAETVESVLSQTYDNLELIIVDNMSTDDTQGYVKGLKDSRIKYFRNPNNGIIAVNRNFGMNQAMGEFIAFLDSDDLWLPRKLEKQIEMFKNNSQLLLVSTNGYYFREKLRRVIINSYFDKQISFRYLLKRNIVISSSVLMKSKVPQYIGFMDEDAELRAVEDYDYWLRLLKYRDNSALMLKDKLVMYRLHQGNLSGFNKLSVSRQSDSLRIIFTKYKDYEEQYFEQVLKRYIKIENKIEGTMALYENRMGVIGVLKRKDIMFMDKIAILIKYFVFRFFPYFGKYFKTKLEKDPEK